MDKQNPDQKKRQDEVAKKPAAKGVAKPKPNSSPNAGEAKASGGSKPKPATRSKNASKESSKQKRKESAASAKAIAASSPVAAGEVIEAESVLEAEPIANVDLVEAEGLELASPGIPPSHDSPAAKNSPPVSAHAVPPNAVPSNAVPSNAVPPSSAAHSVGAQNTTSAQTGTVPAKPRESGSARFLLFNAVPSWFVSMIVHTAIIIMLALFTVPGKETKKVQIDSARAEEVVLLEDFEIEEIEMTEEQVLDSIETQDSNDLPDQMAEMDEQPEIADTIDMPMTTIDLSSFADQHAPMADLAQQSGSSINGDLSSRSNSQRSKMVKAGGGSDASERAVALALEWLAKHQREDGGWDFDHTRGPGGFRTSPNPGNAIRARNGATGLALLPFLGAGQTHLEGKYKKTVERGLKFLIRNQRAEAGAGTFLEPQGNMYSHGICAIALTEAYAMTNDRDLIIPAQAAINYIVHAQDPVGGGWRYQPKQAGDTSAVGWQLMALKSGFMGYLEVPPSTIKRAEQFLDSVSMEDGAYYGYTTPNKGRATTAIGLLSRMYMGWEQDHPALAKGVDYLSKQGPSKTGNVDMYYNYYATQVMRHFGDEEWEKWNGEMRDWLVKQQETEGNLAGSWHFNHPWAERGGRLYNTALSCMVLEVYYRHMPIYRDKAAVEEFPLD